MQVYSCLHSLPWCFFRSAAVYSSVYEVYYSLLQSARQSSQSTPCSTLSTFSLLSFHPTPPIFRLISYVFSHVLPLQSGPAGDDVKSGAAYFPMGSLYFHTCCLFRGVLQEVIQNPAPFIFPWICCAFLLVLPLQSGPAGGDPKSGNAYFPMDLLRMCFHMFCLSRAVLQGVTQNPAPRMFLWIPYVCTQIIKVRFPSKWCEIVYSYVLLKEGGHIIFKETDFLL